MAPSGSVVAVELTLINNFETHLPMFLRSGKKLKDKRHYRVVNETIYGQGNKTKIAHCFQFRLLGCYVMVARCRAGSSHSTSQLAWKWRVIGVNMVRKSGRELIGKNRLLQKVKAS